MDNRCIGVENCIYANLNEECLKCKEKYYYNKTNKRCKAAEGKFEHCQYEYNNSNCERCKDDYYLNKTIIYAIVIVKKDLFINVSLQIFFQKDVVNA